MQKFKMKNIKVALFVLIVSSIHNANAQTQLEISYKDSENKISLSKNPLLDESGRALYTLYINPFLVSNIHEKSDIEFEKMVKPKFKTAYKRLQTFSRKNTI